MLSALANRHHQTCVFPLTSQLARTTPTNEPTYIALVPTQEPLALVPACAPPTLRSALSSFAHWLASLDAVHARRLATLTAPALHARVHRAAQQRLGHAYAALCARVHDPRSRYEAAATLLGAERPFGSVAALWQIFGIDEVEGGD